ncbi:MAG: hypothetical protein ACUBOA_03445 [Candidatus Loosdrechtia sp.]|uniref:hypothetical protein n=1 Tax=Candidatus Loosdrechtia sp. TaxID=3101272 RepID=UPI003A6618D6|nr:MAG: hypothetical protein QY305_12350 [Candidatus Jettenia sp. AMX2]
MKKGLKCYTRKGWLPSLLNGVIYTAISLSFILGMGGLFMQDVYARSVSLNEKEKKVTIRKGDEWRYFKGPQEPPPGWNQSGFDDKSWQRGQSGFGYGQGMARGKDGETLEQRNKTTLGDMRGRYKTVYTRREFIIDNIHAVKNMTLFVDCDGPFIAYLNGIEIIRNVSGLPDEPLDVSGFIHEMFPGENILAVEGSNDDINSDTFSFTPEFELTERQGN